MNFNFRRPAAALFLTLSVLGITAVQIGWNPASADWISDLVNSALKGTTTTTTTSKPVAPSGLAGLFDGQQTVKLTWKDNASNETSQQIWLSKDGSSYTQLATVGSNVTAFTHNLGGTPTVAAHYYTVRAVNVYGASAYSPAAKTVLTSTATPEPSPTTPPPSSIASDVLVEVNKFRAQNGLPALQMDDRLNKAAQIHSDDMAARSTMSHYCGSGKTPTQRITETGYVWRSIAENVAAGQTSAQQVVQAWANSSGHRANMLKTSVKDVGIGYNNRYWTLDLAG